MLKEERMSLKVTVTTKVNGDGDAAIEGVLDVYAARELRANLEPLLDQYHVLSLNLMGVHHVDSSTLGVLVRLSRQVTEGRRRCRGLYFSKVNPSLRQLFKQIKFYETIPNRRPKIGPEQE